MEGAWAVFLGAGLGGVARYGLGLWVAKYWEGTFPLGTLAVNLLGALLMGVLVGALAGWGSAYGQPPVLVRTFLATGVLGGFTTFSAFALETMLLLERHDYALAAAYVGLSLLGGLVALGLGMEIMRHVG